MKNSTKTFTTIDEYIQEFPLPTQQMLIQIRKLIKQLAPHAQEKISYQMPTFYLNGNLVHFAGYAHHIGFYPAPTGLEAFKDEVAQFKHSKGAVQFPLDKPLPMTLISKIVRFRIAENQAKQTRTRAVK